MNQIKSLTQLDLLKEYTTVVADTGDFASISSYLPTDATTNPSLIIKSVQSPTYLPLLNEAVSFAKSHGLSNEKTLNLALKKVFVNFGIEILKIVPGRVSVEVDPKLSFDTEKTIQQAQDLIDLFQQHGVDSSRILIKIATTWEGIQAAKFLETLGIHTNLTLLFSLVQAIACAEAQVMLISPFVGRVIDWHQKNTPSFNTLKDPGVELVEEIFNYYKRFDYPTQIMGASIRSKEQAANLAGCDFLTIPPKVLEELKTSRQDLSCKLFKESAKELPLKKISFDEPSFRFAMNEDPMASEKLSEGIRIFVKDTAKLEKMILERL